MKNELVNKIIEDLKKSGFSSELLSRKTFIENGWSVNAGFGYLDKDEGKSREIDIFATRVSSRKIADKNVLHSEFHVCAEVKKTEKPWIVFDQQTHPHLMSCAWNNLISVINLPCKTHQISRQLAKHSPIALNGWVASGIHESFKNPDQPSRWYSSFVSVSKAAEYYRDKCPNGERTTDDIMIEPCEFHFIQPLIILNGPLYRATLDEDGEIKISEISTASFRFDYRSRNYETGSYRVDLVTLEGLQQYLSNTATRQDFTSDSILSFARRQVDKTE